MSISGTNGRPFLSWLSPIFPQMAPKAPNEEILLKLDAGPLHYVEDLQRSPIQYRIPKAVLDESVVPGAEGIPSEVELAEASFRKLIQLAIPREAKLAAIAEILTKIWGHGLPSLGSNWEIPLLEADGGFENRTYTVCEHFMVGQVSFAYGLEPGIENEDGPSILLLRPRFPWKGHPDALVELSLNEIYDEVRRAMLVWMQSQAQSGSPIRIFAAGLGAWFACRLLLDRGQDLCLDPNHPSYFFDPVGLPPRHASLLDSKQCVSNLKTFLSEGTPLGKVGTLVGDVYSLAGIEDFPALESYYRPLLLDEEVNLVPVDKEQENQCRSRDVLSKGLVDWARKEHYLDIEVWKREPSQLDEADATILSTLAGVIFAVDELGCTT